MRPDQHLDPNDASFPAFSAAWYGTQEPTFSTLSEPYNYFSGCARWWINEATGSTIYDESEDYPGTITSAVWQGDGINPRRWSLNFDGGSKVSIPGIEFANASSPWSVCFRVKWDSAGLSGAAHTVCAALGNYFWRVALVNSTVDFATRNIQVQMGNGGTKHCIPGGLDFPLGSWVHVGITYDGSGSTTGIKFYINGVLDTNTGSGTLTGSDSSGATEFRLGNYFGGYSGQGLVGSIDDVKLCSGVLTAGEVEAHYDTTHELIIERPAGGATLGGSATTSHVIDFEHLATGGVVAGGTAENDLYRERVITITIPADNLTEDLDSFPLSLVLEGEIDIDRMKIEDVSLNDLPYEIRRYENNVLHLVVRTDLDSSADTVLTLTHGGIV